MLAYYVTSLPSLRSFHLFYSIANGNRWKHLEVLHYPITSDACKLPLQPYHRSHIFLIQEI